MNHRHGAAYLLYAMSALFGLSGSMVLWIGIEKLRGPDVMLEGIWEVTVGSIFLGHSLGFMIAAVAADVSAKLQAQDAGVRVDVGVDPSAGAIHLQLSAPL